MTKEMQQPKFCVRQEVRDVNGNSLSPVYEIVKVFWWEASDLLNYRNCFKYILCNTANPEDVVTKKEYEIKSADELCPYEVYGNKMVGKKVKSVEFNIAELVIVFDDNYIAKFSADCGQNQGYLEFGGQN